jgi:hypothetical protein
VIPEVQKGAETFFKKEQYFFTRVIASASELQPGKTAVRWVDQKRLSMSELLLFFPFPVTQCTLFLPSVLSSIVPSVPRAENLACEVFGKF